jgi:hypothetical protein
MALLAEARNTERSNEIIDIIEIDNRFLLGQLLKIANLRHYA